jgi:SAM-dependent methyltransferase
VLVLDCSHDTPFGAIAKFARSVTGVTFGATNETYAHRVLRGAAGRLPVKSASVDVVTVIGDAEWLIDRADGFEEIARVLKPDGVFCFVYRPDLANQAAAVSAGMTRKAIQAATIELPAMRNGAGEPHGRSALLAGNGPLAALLAQLTAGGSATVEQSQKKPAAAASARPARGKNRKVLLADAAKVEPAEVVLPVAPSPAMQQLLDENARLLERALTERNRAEVAEMSLEQWRDVNARLQSQVDAAETRAQLEARSRSDLAQSAIEPWVRFLPRVSERLIAGSSSRVVARLVKSVIQG